LFIDKLVYELDMEGEGSEGTDTELATNEGGMECPLCQKKFDSESSVQGHISGSTDEVHRGKVGQNVMESEASEGSISFPESPEMDTPDPVELAAESVAEPEPEVESDSEMGESDGAESESDEDLGEDGSSSSSGVSGVIGVIGFAALLWFLSRNGERDPEVPEVMIL